MKNKIFLLTALLIAGFAADAAAQMARSDKTTFVAPKQKTSNNASQGITWSIRTGLNVSNITDLDDGDMNYKAKAGFHLGVLADIPVPMVIDGFSVQSGLFYTMRGAKYKESENEEGYKYKYTEKIASHYFQIPVYWSYKYDFGSVAVSAFTGPYIAVGLGGKVKEKYEEEYNGEKEKGSEKYDLFGKDKDDSRNFKRFDFGWSLGAGVTFDRIYVGLQYDFGFINMVREGDAHPKNRNFSLSVGYSF